MGYKIKQTLKYIQETLDIQAAATPIAKSYLDKLPMYINETYKLYQSELFNTKIILAELKNEEELSIKQTEKQIHQMKDALDLKIVLLLQNIPAYNRKRLIEKGINFIVPAKQLYLPELLIDLRETYNHPKTKQKKEKLLPSAQFLLIYHIIHRNENWKLEEHPFKEIAEKLDYTPMTITNAINNLKYHDLVEVNGEKEKFIRFRYNRSELWNITQQQKLQVNPVLKTVFVDEKPKDLFLLPTNASALPEYTDLNPSRQQYYAIEKTVFYGLQKDNALANPNENEGRYALEIWKYNPMTLVGELPNNLTAVDPLSLYLSLKDSKDERLEMALEQIIEKYIW